MADNEEQQQPAEEQTTTEEQPQEQPTEEQPIEEQQPAQEEQQPSQAEQLQQQKLAQSTANHALREAVVAATSVSQDEEKKLESVLADNYKGPLTSTAVNEAFKLAVERTDWSLFAAGTFNMEYIHTLLQLELGLEDLVNSEDQAKYEELQRVIATLNTIIEEYRTDVGGFHSVFADTIAKLEAERAKYEGSQVDIDDMDHAPFHAALEAFKKCLVVSIEHISKEVDLQLQENTQKYANITNAQLNSFAVEADAVDRTSLARLRPSRPEDDMDPWEVSRAEQNVKYESPELQRFFEEEEAARVAVDYDNEWTHQRRDDVDTLVPRAERLVAEQDWEQLTDCQTILNKMVTMSVEKRQVVSDASRDTGEQATTLLTDFRANIQAEIEAGEAYQAKRRDQRERSERDVQRIAEYMLAENETNETISRRFEAEHADNMQSMDQMDAEMNKLREEIAERQRKLEELAEARSLQADAALRSLTEEQQRVSKFNTMMQLCRDYDALLQRSLLNFTLPDQYNGILVECLESSEEVAKGVFERQQGFLGQFMREGTQSWAEAASARYLLSIPPLHRKIKKYEDLDQKAEKSRLQREFCLSTRDPLAEKHATREATLKDMSGLLKKEATDMMENTNKSLQEFNDAAAACEELGLRVPVASVVPIETFAANMVQGAERYILRNPRPPLVSIDHEADDRLVVPPVWFEDDQPKRALAAQAAIAAIE